MSASAIASWVFSPAPIIAAISDGWAASIVPRTVSTVVTFSYGTTFASSTSGRVRSGAKIRRNRSASIWYSNSSSSPSIDFTSR